MCPMEVDPVLRLICTRISVCSAASHCRRALWPYVPPAWNLLKKKTLLLTHQMLIIHSQIAHNSLVPFHESLAAHLAWMREYSSVNNHMHL